MYKRGEIILVNLNPQKNNEAGKIRPCVVISSTEVNEILELLTVLPCTTNLLGEGLFRVFLPTREKLEKDCEVMVEQIRGISYKRVLGSLGITSTQELQKIEQGLKALLEL
ncbi:type II toxin-antitoxin system PemK/MazF family toxin [Sulfurimonas sediminis]|nr:type II toxin-antitoxin system PemK/MazF family toxin [Sulfurimonas sediminis]